MSGILLATHGGESADGAVRVAFALAARLHVPLHVRAFVGPVPLIDYGFGLTYVPTAAEIEAGRAAVLASVKEQLRRCGVPDQPVECYDGSPAIEIERAARTLDAELIVVGQGPHDAIDRALGGETALHLAQVASTPVLAVPATTTAIPRHVVAAVDFSPTSLLAARTAARWLVAGDTLHAVHIAAPARRGARGGPDLDAQARERLAATAGGYGVAPDVRIEQVVLRGDPAKALLEYQRGAGADLIALGSHGYGVWKRLMIGSVASKVIRLSPQAVLVAPLNSLARSQAAPVPPAAPGGR